MLKYIIFFIEIRFDFLIRKYIHLKINNLIHKYICSYYREIIRYYLIRYSYILINLVYNIITKNIIIAIEQLIKDIYPIIMPSKLNTVNIIFFHFILLFWYFYRCRVIKFRVK